jgi:CheY-like chemotaxis protein
MIEVLVVEDNPINQMIVSAMLRELGMQSTVAETIGKADAALHAEAPYHIVLMDMQLPDGDGLELAQRYIARGGRIPILAVTGTRDTNDFRQSCMNAGLVECLEKPFTLKQLESAINAHSASRQ